MRVRRAGWTAGAAALALHSAPAFAQHHRRHHHDHTAAPATEETASPAPPPAATPTPAPVVEQPPPPPVDVAPPLPHAAEPPPPAPPPAPSPRERTHSVAVAPDAPREIAVAPRPVALDIAVGFRGVSRHLSYNQDLGALFQPYDLWIAPAAAAAIEWFPVAHFTRRGILPHLGVYGEGDYAFGVSSHDSTGNTYNTTAYRFGFGLRVRFPLPLEGSDIGLLAGYSGQTFNNVPSMTSSANASIAMNVAYDALRAGLSLRLALGPRWTLLASGGYLYVYSAGDGVTGYFPHVTVGAVDASAGVAYALPAGFELRALLGARRYFFAMNPVVGDPYIVGGALDHYFDATVFIAWRH